MGFVCPCGGRYCYLYEYDHTSGWGSIVQLAGEEGLVLYMCVWWEEGCVCAAERGSGSAW